MPVLSEATRPIMWNISQVWLMYVLFFIAMGVFFFGLYNRVASFRRGKSDNERLGDLGKRFRVLVTELFLQRRTRQSRFPGIFHGLIFYSFVVLGVTTTVVALDYDFGTSLFRGFFYVLLTVGAEFAGFFILVGLSMAVFRRVSGRSNSIETKRSDVWPLVLIATIILSGFLVEGLRIAAHGDRWSYLSPIGRGFAFLFSGVSQSSTGLAHRALWWFHTGLTMFWIATIPYTKFVHLLALPSNIFFSKLRPYGELSRVDILQLLESDGFDEDSFNVGLAKVSDFTWKQRLDFESCVSCGRCEDVCPAFGVGNDFSPKQFIASCRDLVARAEDADDETSRDPSLVGNAFDNNFVWNCRTCTACMEVCPACIGHLDTLIEVRRNLVLIEGELPDEARRALRAMETTGNPFGPQGDRVEWIESLGVPIVPPGEKVDVLYWPGCCTAFDPMKQKIAVDVTNLLRQCEIDFGLLGADEVCCGDPARVLGDERIFQEAAKNQVAALNAREFRVLLTSCPHCYNVLKNEYPQFGGNYNVVHHSEFLHEMLWSKRLQPVLGLARRAVYHDPCYLGRYQNIYESPRQVIKAITGAEVVEMKSSRERSFCCGGGGGHFWMDLKKGERINNLRVKQAVEVNADTIVTACAYCKQMLDDAVKALDLDEQIHVEDIASMVVRAQAAPVVKKKTEAA